MEFESRIFRQLSLEGEIYLHSHHTLVLELEIALEIHAIDVGSWIYSLVHHEVYAVDAVRSVGNAYEAHCDAYTVIGLDCLIGYDVHVGIKLARRLVVDVPIVVITGKADSPLAQMADATLFTGGAPEVCPLGLTPTTSTTMMTVIGDVLVVNVMKLTGFTRHDYALRHHGGYLGHAARGGDGETY